MGMEVGRWPSKRESLVSDEVKSEAGDGSESET